MSKTRVAPARPTTKALTLADVTITWKDDTGLARTLHGQDVAALIRRRLFFAQDAGETPLWQCRCAACRPSCSPRPASASTRKTDAPSWPICSRTPLPVWRRRQWICGSSRPPSRSAGRDGGRERARRAPQGGWRPGPAAPHVGAAHARLPCVGRGAQLAGHVDRVVPGSISLPLGGLDISTTNDVSRISELHAR